jgi:hypothetical protein
MAENHAIPRLLPVEKIRIVCEMFERLGFEQLAAAAEHYGQGLTAERNQIALLHEMERVLELIGRERLAESHDPEDS